MSKIKTKDIIWQENNIVRLLLNRSKHRAKEYGYEFNLEESDLIIPELCPILKIPIVVVRGEGRRFDGPSLDRIDSTKGYTKDNVWIISDLANRMKQNATLEQLKAFGLWASSL